MAVLTQLGIVIPNMYTCIHNQGVCMRKYVITLVNHLDPELQCFLLQVMVDLKLRNFVIQQYFSVKIQKQLFPSYKFL